MKSFSTFKYVFVVEGFIKLNNILDVDRISSPDEDKLKMFTYSVLISYWSPIGYKIHKIARTIFHSLRSYPKSHYLIFVVTYKVPNGKKKSHVLI